LVFPCQRAMTGWVNAATGDIIEVHPTHWRTWRAEATDAAYERWDDWTTHTMRRRWEWVELAQVPPPSATALSYIALDQWHRRVPRLSLPLRNRAPAMASDGCL